MLVMMRVSFSRKLGSEANWKMKRKTKKRFCFLTSGENTKA